MGSPEDEEGADIMKAGETLHEVTLTEGFWLGKYPVTQDQWEKIMGKNPSEYKGEKRPVDSVLWNDVITFL